MSDTTRANPKSRWHSEVDSTGRFSWACIPITESVYAEAEAAERALRGPAGEHAPGDPHQYRITCKVCGERGTIRLSIEPEAPDAT